jgi:TolB-like protein/tetratricopeptide (TPR) repeat protein
MLSLKRAATATCSLVLLTTASTARAQCPDGTPPPCGTTRVAQAGVRVSVPSAAERARRFLILPFRNVTRQTEQEWLVEGSTTMLSDALGRWQGITVVTDEKLYPALKRAGISPGAVADAPSIRRVAEETGGWTAVTGEVLATGGRVRITARAWDVPTNRQLVRAASEVPSGGDVREAFDLVSLRLLQSVGLDSVTPDIANSTTRDLDAYRAYLRGLAHHRRTEIKSAMAAFQDAVKRDSNFALAWARLSEMTLSAEPMSILNPMSPAAQYSARAVRLSAKLPPRQRAVVLASDAQFRAQFTEARRILEDVVREDSSDVDALAALCALEMFDPILISVPGGHRPRGSLNRAARLAKRVVQLDPSRHAMYGLLASLYASAGVPGASPAIAFEGVPSSYPDLMRMLQQRERLRIYFPFVRDSIVLIPAESLSAIPKDSLRAMRKQARSISRSWAERWLTVASDEAAPHQVMSELYAYDGEYANALRELAAAESLGVQTPTWSAPARRLVYVAKSGDLTTAGRLADSLTSAGFFANPNNLLVGGDAAAWSFLLHTMRGGVANARALLEQSIALRRMLMPGSHLADITGFIALMGNEDPEDEPGIPRAVRARQLDSLLARVSHFAASEQLSAWLPLLLPRVAEVVDPKKPPAGRLIEAANALAAKGQTTLAFQLASNAVASDSTLEPEAAKFAWYRTGAEALRAVRLATQSRFHPATASVNAQQAVFEWRVDDSSPFPRGQTEIPPGRAEYRWEVTIEGDGRYHRFVASGAGKTPTIPPATGTLADILTPAASRSVITGALDASGAMKDTTRLQGVTLRTEIAPGVLRMIVIDPAVVGALRRARPSQARFRFQPCTRPVGTIGKDQCVDERVSISYP